MLTDNKEISKSSYWDKIYRGDNDNAPVDASNTKRTSTFDRFQIVVNHAEGKNILDIGSGHAHICKRIKAKFPDAIVMASDQATEAKKVANYEPYLIIDGYDIPFKDKYLDLVIATQCLEYFEFPQKLMAEVKRVSKCFLCTLPTGEMKLWSQLKIWTEESAKEFFEMFGTIEVFESYEGLMLLKVRFP